MLRTIKLTTLAALTFLLGIELPALPANAQAYGDDRLRIVQDEHRVVTDHEVIVPGDRHHRGYREDVITRGHQIDMFIARGPVRLSEEDFLAIIAHSGVDPQLIRRVQAQASASMRDGGIAIGSWIGAGIAGGIADLEFGQDAPLAIRTSQNQVAVNTAGIAAVTLAVVGVVFTLFWMGDAAPHGAPYFHYFSVGEAQAAIDAYNAGHPSVYR